MNATVIKAEQLRSELISLFSTEQIGFTTSETDYGTSCYLTVNDLKIRVSDHDATNSVRVEREIMFKDSVEVSKAIYTVEQIAFPERFEFRKCVAGERPTHIKNGQMLIIKRK